MLSLTKEVFDLNIINNQVSIKGNLSLSGQTHFNGNIEGDIFLEKDSELTIEREGKIIGNFEGGSLIIKGTFIGNIKSSQKVEITQSGSVEGSIKSKDLIIAPGANLKLKINSGNI